MNRRLLAAVDVSEWTKGGSDEWRGDELIEAAIALHTQRMESRDLSKKFTRTIQSTPQTAPTPPQPVAEEEESEYSSSEEESSDESVGGGLHGTSRLPGVDAFNPTPYLSEIMDVIKATEKEQPWLTHKHDDNDVADGGGEASEEVNELEAKERETSESLQKELNKKRKRKVLPCSSLLSSLICSDPRGICRTTKRCLSEGVHCRPFA